MSVSPESAHVVDIDRENRDADLQVPGSLPVRSFDCVIVTQVLQFLSPETASANVWASLAPMGSSC